MGEVYQAFDSELRQDVAIKTLRAPNARDPAMAQQFRVEVLRSRQITHRSVTRVHDLFTQRADDGSGIPFFTMESIAGETLSERLPTEPPFAPEAALDAAHAAGIVHRDFKPGNVFLSRGADGAGSSPDGGAHSF